MEKNYQPKITEVKILMTVSYLNGRGFYPLPYAVTKIFTGIIDEETVFLQDCPTFNCLVSINSKTVSRLINQMIRYGYLKKVYDIVSNRLYIGITEKGQKYMESFVKNHNMDLAKKRQKCKKTIAKIG